MLRPRLEVSLSHWIVETLFRVCIEPLYQLQQSLARTTHSPSLAGWNFQTIFRQLTFSSPPKWSQPPSAPTNANCFTAVAPLFFAPVSEDLLSTFRLIETIETLVPTSQFSVSPARVWWLGPCERCSCSVQLSTHRSQPPTSSLVFRSNLLFDNYIY